MPDLRLRENRHLRPQSSGEPAGHEQDAPEDYQPTDDELGIGEEIAEPTPIHSDAERIAEVMADPIISAAIQQLVEQRVADMAANAGVSADVAAPTALPSGNDFMSGMRLLAQEMAGAINRSTQATVEQMPGHVKPLPVEEVEARMAAFVEMKSLVKEGQRRYYALLDAGDHIKAEDEIPVYLLEEDFFGEEQMFLAGETIRWFREPGTYMRPRNAIAKRLSEAMWRSIGNEAGPSAEDLAVQASQMRRPAAMGLGVSEVPTMQRSPLTASRVDVPTVPVGPERINGTIVTERRGGFGRGAETPRIESLPANTPY